MRRILTALLFGAIIGAAPAMAAPAAQPGIFKGLNVTKSTAKDDLHQAYGWLYSHDYERAAFLVNSALKKGLSKSDQALAHTYLGQTLLMQQKNDEAIAEFGEAVKLDKTQGAAFGNRAMLYAKQNKYDLAVADFNQAVKVSPYTPDWWAQRADAYMHLGQPAKAIPDYDKAIKLKANYGPYLTARGRALLKKGDNDKAIADFDKALKLRPEKSVALYNRGTAKRAKGDASGANADIAQAHKFNVNIDKSPDIK